MRRLNFIFAVASLIILTVCSAFAQTNIITTVAGGGSQNNIPGLVADLPSVSGVAVDGAGNAYFASLLLHQVFKRNTSGQLFVVAGTGTCGNEGDGGPAVSGSLCYPRGIALDSSGNLFIADSSNNRIRRVDASNQIMTTVAGSGAGGYSGDGGPATSAGLFGPYGVAVDGAGDLFIADSFDHCIRRVDATTKFISTVAGTGTAGFSGDGGAATGAKLNFPTEVALDGSGNLFIVDTNNERIRRVDALTHDITTVAGNGQTGFNGDNTSATSASLCSPYGVALDASGNLFIADTCSSRLRRVDATTQNITTVAGDGAQDFTGDGGLAVSAALNSPQAVAIDSTGNLFIADTNNGRIRRVDKLTADITTIAGGGTGGDNGAATSAILITPSGLAVDGSGNLLIADNQNNRIRRVDRDTHTITTVAGNGIPGFSGNGSSANLAQMWGPWGIALDSSDNLFISDTQNFRIRGVDATTQTISTIAGTGFAGYSGDGGLATSARLGALNGVAADTAGNLFLTESGTDSRVRRVDAITHFITTVAGIATSGYSGDGGLATRAQLSTPTGVAVDSSGNQFIADTGNHCIRRVDATTHLITTVAGNGTPGFSGDGGPATGAQLWFPYGVGVDSSGNLLIADTSNDRIRRVDALTHIITTVAGNGAYGFSGDGGPAVSAELSAPYTVTTDSSGNLFIADGPNNRVRATALPPFIVVQPGTLFFSSQNLATSSAAQAVTLTNTGLVPLSIASIGITSGFTETDNCAAAINPLATCTINVNFAPTTPGAQSGTITITDNAFASPHVISTSGTGVGPVASLSGPSLTFSNQLAGTTSSAQTVTLNNTGNGSMTISNIAASGDFAATNNCNGSVAADGSCTISITFKPTVVGARNGTLTVTDDSNGVAGSTQTASLSGTGTGPTVALSGSSLGFGNQLVSAASAAQTVTVTNSGTMNLTISTASISGTNAGDFAKSTDTCSGATLAPNSTCAVSVAFTPAATGSRSASLNFTDNALDSPQAVALAGTGTAPVVSLSGSSMTFASQLVSTTSAAQSVTVTNTGTGNLTIATAALGGTNAGDFTKSADTCTGATVTPNNTCAVSVTFTPSAMGSRSGSLIFTDSATGSPHAVGLAGTGIAPIVSLSIPSVTFANQLVSTTSAAQTVIVTNSGTANLTISAAAVGGTNAGDFAKSADTCTGATVTPNSTCTVSVTFTPSAAGSRSTSLSFADNASGSPHTVGLSGTGIAPAVSLPGSSVTFANQLVSTTSAAQTVTVTNSGTANLTISTATIGGTNAGDFAKGTDTCTGATVAPTNACAVSVTFTPAATGSRSASLNFADNASGSPHAVGMSGAGIAPAVSLPGSSVTFANQLISTTSAAQTVTVTNSGTANLTISTATIGGTNAVDFAKGTDTCTGATVTPNNTCAVSVTFVPSATGSRSASLSFADNAAGSPHAVALTGNGQDFSIGMASGSTSTATIARGQAATYSLSMSGLGSLNQTINFTCTGAPSEATCTVNPSSVSSGASGTVALTVTVTTTAASLAPPVLPPASPFRLDGIGRLGALLLLGLLISASLAGGIAGMKLQQKVFRYGLGIAALMVLALAMAACGGGGGSGGGGYHDPGTPAGTYTLTVMGSASGLQHSTTLTLTVN